MKNLMLRAAALLLGSLLLALGWNALRPEGGIPLLRPSQAELALREGVTPVHLDTAKLLHQQGEVLFLDARPPRSYARGHIPGAISFPEEEFAQRIAAFRDTVPLDRPLLAYCDGIECRASELLTKALKEQGYRYLYLFFGGWGEWRQAGEVIEK